MAKKRRAEGKKSEVVTEYEFGIVEDGAIGIGDESVDEAPQPCLCRVISFNEKTGRVVFECNGRIYQSDVIEYDGKSGFVEWSDK